ncbi:MAG TPA: BON domain-containing protein [Acidobacteriota bacterium]|jgi:hypothetical protein
MNKALGFITATGLGAGLMYIMDPDIGRRRRALARDKAVRGWHKTEDTIEMTSRDFSNRAYGMLARASSAFSPREVSDEVLTERIRSRMGRYVSHPGAIQVSTNNGQVTLQGDILSKEVEKLIAIVKGIHGVERVHNRLQVHDSAENVPALQGHSGISGERFELSQRNWSPTARLMIGATGGMMALYGIRHGGTLGGAMGTLGLGLIARGLLHDQCSRSEARVGSGQKERQDDQTPWGRSEEPRFSPASNEAITEPAT